jgi:tetratricopeptide (TPR) repeat protein/mono/diheme cytochrome c family protein
MAAALRWLGGLMALTSAGAAMAAQPGRATTFAEVAPILATHCAECHQPNGPGPFSVLAFTDVRQHARQILEAMRSGRMPPWQADRDSGPFVGQSWPTAEEIAAVARWVEQGAGNGDRETPAVRPGPPDGWRLGEPDLVVTLDQPYLLPADGPDVFRIFVVRVPLAESRYVRGVELRPGNRAAVHHVNIRFDQTPASRILDARDPLPGYDGLLARTALFPDGHFLGWTPGQAAPLVPPSLAWPLRPAADMVLQVHMKPTGKPERIQPSIGFYFSGAPPTDRPVMLRLGRQNIDIPAGTSDYVVTDQYRLPVDVVVQSLQPHAHYRARDIRATATLPDGSSRTLLTIRDWQFGWQHVYRFVTPMTLPKDTVLAMRYTYDNSAENPRNPVLPPGRVSWGQRSTEEMGDLWIQVLTSGREAWLTLNKDFRLKAVAEDLVGYEALLAAAPTDAALHEDAAVLYLELGPSSKALEHFEAALSIEASPTRHFNVATASHLVGDLARAERELREAVRLDPRYANAWNSLGVIVASAGRLEEARGYYEEAVRADPSHAQARNNLGSALAALGDPQAALEQYREALRANPQFAEAHFNLAVVLRRLGHLDEALEHLREANRLQPDWPAAARELQQYAPAPPH